VAPQQRATLLRALANTLEQEREALVVLADSETALGLPRLNGELDRTAFQLRHFADIAERGDPFAWVDAPATPGAPPKGHPAMQRWNIPLGPVAMFSASNFPFAFSVLGGDTASALAAGCSVVVKAHPGHVLLSQRMHSLVQSVLKTLQWPPALVGMVQGQGQAIGMQLVNHPAMAAVAFTGSTRGGMALGAAAAARPRPIPFFGELGSINPVLALPQKLAVEGAALAQQLAGSIALGCGQFCTSPGVLVLIDDPLLAPDAVAVNDLFVQELGRALQAQTPHAMLTQGMRAAFDVGVDHWVQAGAHLLLRESAPATQPPRPVLAQVEAQQFIDTPPLREEVFGPACLVLRASDTEMAQRVLQAVGGSLTVTLWGFERDSPQARSLVLVAMHTAGRVLFGGVPTGVAVNKAQQHGGPWPSSTRPDSTSVGDAALLRFLRPVSLQQAPEWVLAGAGQLV
jgi:acyl-CoA reductase-like NAD-dependent aldehyde dehydrogenase